MKSITLPRLVAALASGLVLFVISPPYGLHWLHWFSFLPLFWALREDDNGGNTVIAWLAGFFAVHTLFFWLSESIVRFSNIPNFAAMQLIALFAFGFAFPYALVFGFVHPIRKRVGAAWIFIIPALQVATEFLGPALFPYYHGVSQYRVSATWQLASVTGVYGVSYLVFLTNCALAEIVYSRRDGKRLPVAPLVAAAVLFLSNIGFGAWRYAKVEAEVAGFPALQVTQLQQGITMEERMGGTAREAMQSWMRLSGSLIRQGEIDLVVWPEGATPYDPRSARIQDAMEQITRNLEAPIIFGGGFAEKKTDPNTGRRYVEQRNSIYYMGADGEIVDRYDKMVPLPFGEYLPLSDTFPILKEWIEGPGDFEPGQVPIYFELETSEGTALASSPICYEAILSSFVRENLSDAELFVNVTNDGWFGDTSAPHQHAMLSAVRSMELGVPMIRLAYTGVSMHVSPSGRISHETQPFTEVARILETPVGRIETVYRKIGDVFAWLCVLIAGAGIVLTRRAPKES